MAGLLLSSIRAFSEVTRLRLASMLRTLCMRSLETWSTKRFCRWAASAFWKTRFTATSFVARLSRSPCSGSCDLYCSSVPLLLGPKLTAFLSRKLLPMLLARGLVYCLIEASIILPLWSFWFLLANVAAEGARRASFDVVCLDIPFKLICADCKALSRPDRSWGLEANGPLLSPKSSCNYY